MEINQNPETFFFSRSVISREISNLDFHFFEKHMGGDGSPPADLLKYLAVPGYRAMVPGMSEIPGLNFFQDKPKNLAVPGYCERASYVVLRSNQPKMAKISREVLSSSLDIIQ